MADLMREVGQFSVARTRGEWEGWLSTHAKPNTVNMDTLYYLLSGIACPDLP